MTDSSDTKISNTKAKKNMDPIEYLIFKIEKKEKDRHNHEVKKIA